MKSITWEVLTHYFDSTGNLSVHHRDGKGNHYRLRMSSYDKQLLEQFRKLLGRGSISREIKRRGTYYRLEVGGLAGTCEVLTKLLPHLRKKHKVAEQWLKDWEPFIGLAF